MEDRGRATKRAVHLELVWMNCAGEGRVRLVVATEWSERGRVDEECLSAKEGTGVEQPELVGPRVELLLKASQGRS